MCCFLSRSATHIKCTPKSRKASACSFLSIHATTIQSGTQIVWQLNENMKHGLWHLRRRCVRLQSHSIATAGRPTNVDHYKDSHGFAWHSNNETGPVFTHVHGLLLMKKHEKQPKCCVWIWRPRMRSWPQGALIVRVPSTKQNGSEPVWPIWSCSGLEIRDTDTIRQLRTTASLCQRGLAQSEKINAICDFKDLPSDMLQC